MTDIPSPEEFMSVEECARVVRVEPAQFRRWVKDGKVPGVKIGKRWLIRTVDFRAWLDERGKRAEPVALAGGRVYPGGPAVMGDRDIARGPVEASGRWVEPRIVGDPPSHR
jgi:excisionase family DNA binding protein